MQVGNLCNDHIQTSWSAYYSALHWAITVPIMDSLCSVLEMRILKLLNSQTIFEYNITHMQGFGYEGNATACLLALINI